MKRTPKNTTTLLSRKISAAEELSLKPRDGRAHWLSPFLTTLAVGESFYLVRSDWTWRSRGPAQMVKRLSASANMRFKVMVCSDNTGWVIRRMG